MYQDFTDTARKVMQEANTHAQQFNHEYILPEHVLLGILNVEDCSATRVLARLLDLEKIRHELVEKMEHGPKMVGYERLPATPRARAVIKKAVEEAKRLGQSQVATAHLLLGLLHKDNSPTLASNVLNQQGITYSRVYEIGLQLDGPEGNFPPATPTLTVILTPDLVQSWAGLLNGIFCEATITTEDATRIMRMLGTDCPERRMLLAEMELFSETSRMHSAWEEALRDS